MVDLDNNDLFVKVLEFELNTAFTYADTRPGHTDREKREEIRQVASRARPLQPITREQCQWWAFRIKVCKSGNVRFDIENVPKLFIDAFCGAQINNDMSTHTELAFYEDDTIDHVKYLEIYGDRVQDKSDERTQVEIFGRIAH